MGARRLAAKYGLNQRKNQRGSKGIGRGGLTGPCSCAKASSGEARWSESTAAMAVAGKTARSQSLTVPRLEPVVVVEVDEPDVSPRKVSARGKLGGDGNDGAAATASSGADELEGERNERGERAC